MKIISFPCPNCKFTLKIGEDKAGKRARCPKCKFSLVIPSPSQPQSVPSNSSVFEDDEDGVYQLRDEPESPKVDSPYLDKDEDEDEDEDEEDEEDKPKIKHRKRDLASLRKAPIHPEKWQKVRLGMVFVIVGLFAWLLSFGLHKLVLFVGMLMGPMEYGYLASSVLVDPAEPPVLGYSSAMNRAHFAIGLIGGARLLDVWVVVFLVTVCLSIFQLLSCGTGYALCIAAPTRYGMMALAIATLGVAVFNLLLQVLFRLLPMLGVTFFGMTLVVVPEVALTQANIGRLEPIHVSISPSPFWEGLFTILIRLMFYLEPVLFCIFLQAVAKMIQDVVLEAKAHALIRLGLGLAFMDSTFLLLANAGTSDVLVLMLRIAYLLWQGFYLWFLIWLIMVIFMARARIERAIQFS